MFTLAEINLMIIYNTGTRQGLIAELENMKPYLAEDEVELLQLANSAINKLQSITDDAYTELDLDPFGQKGW